MHLLSPILATAEYDCDGAGADDGVYRLPHRGALGGPDIALVVGRTMLLVVIVGNLVGMSLSFLRSRLRLDPATASAPLVTITI